MDMVITPSLLSSFHPLRFHLHIRETVSHLLGPIADPNLLDVLNSLLHILKEFRHLTRNAFVCQAIRPCKMCNTGIC